MAEETIYECSDGSYYGDVDIWERFESGVWAPCCWDEDSGTEWVETRSDELLVLTPVPLSSVPDHIQIERVATGLSVTHSQRTVGW
jgi:hypothetical protein